MNILNRKQLESSSVVANSLMNRERVAFGINSYTKELKFNPFEFLKNRFENKQSAYWLEICCGKGNAIIQIAHEFNKFKDQINNVLLVGVDLISFFSPIPDNIRFVKFIESSIFDYRTELKFDLITCVHGMHYLGDKLKIIEIVSNLLKSDGYFTCNLNTKDIIDQNGRCLFKKINLFFKDIGLNYNSRNKILINSGVLKIQSPFKYIGANDKIGTNYTGENSVQSIYS